MISVGVNIKLKGLDQVANELPRLIKSALADTATHGRNMIEDRAFAGKGYEGWLKPYTQDYRLMKRKKRKDWNGKVDLHMTNSMFNSTQVESGMDYAKIYFDKATEAKKAYFVNKTRPFFGFSSSEKRELYKFFNSKVMK